MGLVHAEIQLLNLKDKILVEEGYLTPDKARTLKIKMMVDSGAVMMAINESIVAQLGLKSTDKQSFSLANGQIIELNVVGGIEVKFKNRWCITDAIVLPGETEPLLGAVPKELMDLVISPFDNSLEVNPKHPIKPQHTLGGIQKS